MVAAKSTKPATIYTCTNYQRTRKRDVRDAPKLSSSRSAVLNPSVLQASFSPALACSFDTFVIAKAFTQKSRLLLHKLGSLRHSVSFLQYMCIWGMAIIWWGCGQSITLLFRENKNRENFFWRVRTHFHKNLHQRKFPAIRYPYQASRKKQSLSDTYMYGCIFVTLPYSVLQHSS